MRRRTVKYILSSIVPFLEREKALRALNYTRSNLRVSALELGGALTRKGAGLIIMYVQVRSILTLCCSVSLAEKKVRVAPHQAQGRPPRHDKNRARQCGQHQRDAFVIQERHDRFVGRKGWGSRGTLIHPRHPSVYQPV